ncbi:YybH family protein [Jejudonia soesokkakensis]|uniref:YybH family protein n=1 Tax=Jejudonia soesokkakensis TaxID=1323432 RepID=A0ABW2MU84_9FLAO
MKTPITLFLVCLTLGISIPSNAQEIDNPIAKEIIEQVWKPFKFSYEARDAETFKSIHTDDMLRITDSDIKTGEEYKATISNWTELPKGTTMTIDFAMESSNLQKNIAYQVGYYRVNIVSEENPPGTYYGQFHVVLKKIDDVWKIIQDFDTSEVNGVIIDEKSFDKARLLLLEK